jgi:hypothetical protein
MAHAIQGQENDVTTILKAEKTRFEQAAEAGDFAEAVAIYVETYRHVSYVELQRCLAPYMETSGTFEQVLAGRNVVFWVGMSREFIDALEQAEQDGRIHPEPANWLVYLIDGRALSLPVARRIPEGGYKKPRWCPIVFNPGPAPKLRRKS